MPKQDFSTGDYVEVKDRLKWFFDKYPEGSLHSELVHWSDTLVIVRAFAYRTADDRRPGSGLAAEPIPGKTPFTRDSEYQNAETSAWGRALAAIGTPVNKGIASADEVRARSESLTGPLPTVDPKTCEHPPLQRVVTTPTGRTLPEGSFYCEACGTVIREPKPKPEKVKPQEEAKVE